MQANIAYFKQMLGSIRNGGVWIYPAEGSIFAVDNVKMRIQQRAGPPLNDFVKESICRAGYAVVEPVREGGN